MSHYNTYLQSLSKAEQDASTARQQALVAETHWQALWAAESAQMEAALQKDFPGIPFSGVVWKQCRRGKETTLHFVYDHDSEVYGVSPDEGENWYDSPTSWLDALEAHRNLPAFAAFLKQFRSGV